EQRGTDADGDGAGEQEFGGVLPALDAAHTDDRNVRRLGDRAIHAADQVHGDGLDRWSAQAAGYVRQPRATLVDVDRHRGEGVDQREDLRAAVDRGPRGQG